MGRKAIPNNKIRDLHLQFRGEKEVQDIERIIKKCQENNISIKEFLLIALKDLGVREVDVEGEEDFFQDYEEVELKHDPLEGMLVPMDREGRERFLEALGAQRLKELKQTKQGLEKFKNMTTIIENYLFDYEDWNDPQYVDSKDWIHLKYAPAQQLWEALDEDEMKEFKILKEDRQLFCYTFDQIRNKLFEKGKEKIEKGKLTFPSQSVSHL